MLIDDKMIILDGGMGHEIKKRALPFNVKGDEWSASILLSDNLLHFQELVNIHCDFINAGAKIITTNSFSVTPCDIGEQAFLTHTDQN